MTTVTVGNVDQQANNTHPQFTVWNTVDLERGNSLSMCLSSIISITCSLVLVITWLIFPRIRRKVSVRVIVYLSLSNILASAATVVGEQYSGTSLCWFEGVVCNIGQLMSFFWTVKISKMIHDMLSTGKPATITYTNHLICWGLPVVITLLPLSNATYGSPVYDDDFTPYGYCWVVEDSRTPSWGLDFWHWFSFYVWIWGSMLLIAKDYVMIARKANSVQISDSTRKQLTGVVSKLRPYPIVMFVSWIWACITDLRPELQASDMSASISFWLSGLQGAFTGIIFFITNHDVSEHWRVLFRSRFTTFTGDQPHLRKTSDPAQSAFAQSMFAQSMRMSGRVSRPKIIAPTNNEPLPTIFSSGSEEHTTQP